MGSDWCRSIIGVTTLLVLTAIARLGNAQTDPGKEAEAGFVVAQQRLGAGARRVAPGNVTAPSNDNLSDLLATADTARGRELSKQCGLCHSFDRRGARGFDIGPELWDIVGRRFGGDRTFLYSRPLAQRRGRWGYEELFAFLENPQGYIPGTSMRFPGVTNQRDRADLILYLRELSDDPLPLPLSPSPSGSPPAAATRDGNDGRGSGAPVENVAAQADPAAYGLGPVAAIEFDPVKAALGRRLFFDARLSGDATISCATCHDPQRGFTDGLALSPAYPGSMGFRNTPTLINTAYKAVWFHDGRLGTNLNDVTRESITESYIMNMDMRLMQERLKQDSVYVGMFAEAGYGEPSNSAVLDAIPEYLKTLTSRNSPFPDALSPAARRGLVLFTGPAGCVSCHSGPRFTDDAPHNVGVPENPEIWGDPLRHITFVTFAKAIGIENYMNVRRDPGAQIRTHRTDGSTVGTFITPTLRELTHTAPYMHNGVFATLADVVAFFNAGGGTDPNRDPTLRPLGLTDEEQRDLVAFLESLSGDPLTGPDFVWQDGIPAAYPAVENWLGIGN